MAKYYAKLRGKITEVFGSQKDFAAALGITMQTLTNKLNKRSKFSVDDIVLWSELLHIDKDEITLYFFTDELSKS